MNKIKILEPGSSIFPLEYLKSWLFFQNDLINKISRGQDGQKDEDIEENVEFEKAIEYQKSEDEQQEDGCFFV